MGTMESPSMPLGGLRPASSAAVGRKSQKAQTRSLVQPALIRPGQRTIIGTRDGVGEIKEKGIFLIQPNEIQRRPGEHVVGVVAFLPVDVAAQLPLAFVAPKELRKVIVGLPLIEVTEPFIESLPVRHAAGS